MSKKPFSKDKDTSSTNTASTDTITPPRLPPRPIRIGFEKMIEDVIDAEDIIQDTAANNKSIATTPPPRMTRSKTRQQEATATSTIEQIPSDKLPKRIERIATNVPTNNDSDDG